MTVSPTVKIALCLFALLYYPATASAQAPAEAEADPPAEEESEPAASIEYDKGFKVTSGDGDFELKTGIRSQFRYELVREEAEEDEEFQSRFYIPRLRLQLEGHAFGEANAYKVEFELSGRGQTILKDFYVDHTYVKGIQIRAGQWKKPFSRHELVSDYSSTFNERALANGMIDAARDSGVMVHNGYDKSPDGIEWALGVFNAQRADRNTQEVECEDPADATTCTVGSPTNLVDDWGPLMAARLGYNFGGIKGYSEGDLEGGPLRLAVGVGYLVDFNNLDEDEEGDLLLEHGATADFLLKIHGFDLEGGVYMLKAGDADAEVSFLGQAGYFLLPKRLQVAGRYSLTPNLDADDEDTQEILGALNIYFKDHTFKWATDAGVITSSVDDTTDLQIRTMLQFVL
jgi:phosphate-selective porin OprO and OprP